MGAMDSDSGQRGCHVTRSFWLLSLDWPRSTAARAGMRWTADVDRGSYVGAGGVRMDSYDNLGVQHADRRTFFPSCPCCDWRGRRRVLSD